MGYLQRGREFGLILKNLYIIIKTFVETKNNEFLFLKFYLIVIIFKLYEYVE